MADILFAVLGIFFIVIGVLLQIFQNKIFKIARYEEREKQNYYGSPTWVKWFFRFFKTRYVFQFIFLYGLGIILIILYIFL